MNGMLPLAGDVRERRLRIRNGMGREAPLPGPGVGPASTGPFTGLGSHLRAVATCRVRIKVRVTEGDLSHFLLGERHAEETGGMLATKETSGDRRETFLREATNRTLIDTCATVSDLYV